MSVPTVTQDASSTQGHDGPPSRRRGGAGRGRRSLAVVARLAALLVATSAALSVSTAVASADFGFEPGATGFAIQSCMQTDGTCATPDDQAGGHPGSLVTTMVFNQSNVGGVQVPDGDLADLTVTLPSGLTADPQAVPACKNDSTQFLFGSKKAGLVGGCPADTQIGLLVVDLETGGSVYPNTPIEIYNLTPGPGQPALFGGILPVIKKPIYLVGGVDAATGSEYVTVSNIPAGFYILDQTLTLWGAPEEQNACSPTGQESSQYPPSQFASDGVTPNCGNTDNAFITNPPTCSPAVPPASNTATVSGDAYVDPTGTGSAGDESTAARTPSVSGTPYAFPVMTDCAAEPTESASMTTSPLDASGNPQASVAADSPTGLQVGLTFSQDSNPADIAPSPLQSASVVLPAGFSINPAAVDPNVARPLVACTDAQFDASDTSSPITCPGANASDPTTSQVGTVSITSPDITDPLTGNVYLATQTAGNPFRIFIDASADGVDIRLIGSISSDPTTGQLTTTLDNLPQLPVSGFQLSFAGSPSTATPAGSPIPTPAVLASPLDCGTGTVQASLAPWSGNPVSQATATLTTDADGHGGPCPSTLPFAPVTSVAPASTQAGAFSALTVGFSRAPQQPFLQKVKLTLPPGLTGLISSVPLCSSGAAAAGSCPTSSLVGTVAVAAGAGPNTVTVNGPVYLAGPYTDPSGTSYPFSLSIVVPVSVGPFNFGTQVEQAGISVDPVDAHLTTVTSLPLTQSFQVGAGASTPPQTCPAGTTAGCEGLLLRIRSVSLSLNRPNFILNPTSCASLGGSSTLGGADPFAGTTSSSTVALGAQFTGCSALPFAPKLTVSAPAATPATAGTTGAGVEIKLTQGSGQSNTKTVALTLPSALSVRLSTANGACPAATYAAGASKCPAGSQVGTVTAVTPLLPGSLTGPAYLVSQGSAGLPNLDVVLSGDGVTFDLAVAIAITPTGVTSSLTAPDVPISSFDLDLPASAHSAFSATESLCSASSLSAAATISSQSGVMLKQSIPVSVTGCAAPEVAVLKHSYKKGTVMLSVKAPDPGRLSASGSGFSLRGWVFRRVTKATTTTLSVPLSHRALRRLRKSHRLKLIIRVGFLPRSNHISPSRTFVTINLRS